MRYNGYHIVRIIRWNGIRNTGGTMSLNKTDLTGQSKLITSAPFPVSHKNLLNKLTTSQLDELYQFIRDTIQNEKQFTVATKFGHASLAWKNVPLIYLWDISQRNYELAASLLGLVVMDVLIADGTQWNTIKTVVGHRDFATNFYWRAA